MTDWADRERRTGQLVRLSADHMFNTSVTAKKVYCLCRLTWITKSHKSKYATYIRSVKLPALSEIFGRSYSSIEAAANHLVSISGDTAARELVTQHTGFTNTYNAYRNSSGDWIGQHYKKLLPLFRMAYTMTSDEERRRLMRRIADLPPIPNPNDRRGPLKPEYLLTPVFFALDQGCRFPILNGRPEVRRLLSKRGVRSATLSDQFDSCVSLYGTKGVTDAADLDVLASNPAKLKAVVDTRRIETLLHVKPTVGNELPLKDEADIKVIRDALVLSRRRTHNRLTNALKELLTEYTVREGNNPSAMYDIVIEDYNGANADLLVEVKGSTHPAEIRMAIGQLYAYWFALKGDCDPNLALLLPEAPEAQLVNLLRWLGIGVLWFSGNSLKTSTPSLRCLTRIG
ncbi:MAG TPA: hypothetical protein VHU18_05025 [Rhizomicrobium sp.]|jgi:hypothetical protein|nr:hypothetical protein [Rhizomicrobium sp.]